MTRPHKNLTFATICANPACRKEVATQSPFSEGFILTENGRPRIVVVCRACVEKGWRPPGYRDRSTR